MISSISIPGTYTYAIDTLLSTLAWVNKLTKQEDTVSPHEPALWSIPSKACMDDREQGSSPENAFNFYV